MLRAVVVRDHADAESGVARGLSLQLAAGEMKEVTGIYDAHRPCKLKRVKRTSHAA